jgi:hypothetical protein
MRLHTQVLQGGAGLKDALAQLDDTLVLACNPEAYQHVGTDPDHPAFIAQFLRQLLGHPQMLVQPTEFAQTEEGIPQVEPHVDG